MYLTAIHSTLNYFYLIYVYRCTYAYVMKLFVEIPDKEAVFAIKVLKSLSFVRTVKPMSPSTLHLLKNLNEAAEEVRLHKQGKLKLKTAAELLNEL